MRLLVPYWLCLRRIPACLVLLGRPPLPPVRQVAAGAAIELLGDAVITSWAHTPIVILGFHCLVLSFIFVESNKQATA